MRVLKIFLLTLIFFAISSKLFSQKEKPRYVLYYEFKFESPLDGSVLNNNKIIYYLNESEGYIIKEAILKLNDSARLAKMKNMNLSEEYIKKFENALMTTQNKFDKEFFYFNFLSKLIIKHLYNNETDSYFDVEDFTKSIEWQIIDSFVIINKSRAQYAKGHDSSGNSYFAWFVNEIPASIGPEGINGLPGLIVEVKIIDSKNSKRLVKVTKVEIESEIMHDFSKYTFSKVKMSQTEFSKRAQDQLNNLKLLNQNN